MKTSLYRSVAWLSCCGAAAGILSALGCSKDNAKISSATAVEAAPTAAATAPDAGPACVAGEAPPRSLVDAIAPAALMRAMTAVADWQLANPAKWATNSWQYAAFWVGMTDLAPLADDGKYYDAIRKNGETNEWKPAERPGHADDQAITSSYFYLYSVDREHATIEPALARFDEMSKKTFDASLAWDETKHGETATGQPPIYDREWAWCDALFMAPPAMAQATTNTGDMKYLDLANKLWWKTTDYLYDKDEHLYYRDSRFFTQKEPNGKKVFWSRGNGWVMAGTARMLQNMPEGYPDRGRYIALFKDMAAKVASLQGKDGFWRASLLDPDDVPRPESSGTGFYTYALAWGVNQGLLDRAMFEPVVRKGWTALTGALLPGGKLGWVQEVGFKPGDTCWDRTEVYGAGAFLLAGSEIYRSTLLADSPRITRSIKNPKAEARFDEIVEVPLRPDETKAVAGGEKLVAIDGRSGDLLATKPKEGAANRLLVLVSSLHPSEERQIHIYRVPAATRLPPVRGRGFRVPVARKKQAVLVVTVKGA